MPLVPRWLVKLVILLVVLTCLWGHVSEIFDRWDQTLQTGNDVEFSLVLLALVAGAVLALSASLPASRRARASSLRMGAGLNPLIQPLSRLIHPTDSSPHLSLRI